MSDGPESVLVITQYFPPETGAAATRWDELAGRFADETDVTVITSAPDYPDGELLEGYDNAWLRRERRDGVDVIYTKTIPAASGNLPRRALKFVWFMLASLVAGLRYTSPSAVVATSPQPLTGVSAWLVARLKRAAFVFEVRDLWPESILAVSDFDNRLVIWLLDRTVNFLYRRADRVVVLSQAFVDPIADCGVSTSAIAFHPNGIDLEFYESDADGTADTGAEAVSETEAGSDAVPDGTDEQFTVTYVGTIGRAHGLDIVLEAASDLPEVQFLMVGDGAERERLARRAKDLDNVVFTGLVPKAEVPAILRAADVALVHLKPRDIFETVLPSKLLEAMAAGLPVILGVRGEAARLLSAADAGIAIAPGAADELVAAVETLRDDDQRRETFAANGRSYVVDHFDWDTISEDYLETLTETAART
jgi:glycosyltransferase involved in cell wall biosynthesis